MRDLATKAGIALLVLTVGGLLLAVVLGIAIETLDYPVGE